MRPVDLFLEALEKDSWSDVLDLVNRHHLRSDDLNIEEFLQTLPKKSRPRLCEALSAKAIKVVRRFQELFEEAEQEGNAEIEDGDDNENKRLSLYTDLRALLLLIRVSLEECQDGASSGKLLPAVEAVHSVLLGLEEDASLQDSVARVCEAWWAHNLPGRERIMAQTIPYLVARALDNGKAADVHRVYAVRQAVPMFDFADESIESLKKLLLRSAFAPPFLKSADGKRFITYLCGLNAGMVREIFAIVRNQIPSGRKSILETYGDILFKAWKVASGPCLYELEQNCVQRLMEACLYASTPSLASNIRRVLGGFHSQKKQRGVDELLLRLYEPLLFRALQVANTSVRHNALLLFVDVFPLQNPDAPHDQTDALLQKQVALLDKLLSDPAPIVRASAVEGVCRILRVFWELIPSQTTAKLIARLVEEMSYDGASSAVRSAVLDGVTYLLHNPLSHPLVKAVLPRLAPMINDTVPKVRLSAVELLLAVRNIQSLDKVDEKANLEALHKTLAMADSPMAKKLTRLLLRSYVPGDRSMSEAAEKVLALIKQNASAGVQLCRHVQDQGVPVDTVVQIATHLCTTVTESSIASGPVKGRPTSKTRVSKRKAGTDITNGAQTEKQSAVLSVEEQEGILEAVAALAKGMLDAKTEVDVLVGAFPGNLLIALLEKAASGVARSSVLRLASSLPPSEIPALIQHCARRLAASVTPESDPAACDEIRAVLSFITSWGGLPDLSAAIAVALSSASSSPPVSTEPTPLKGKKRGRKKGAASTQDHLAATPVGGAAADAMTSTAAARYVELLLEAESNRAGLLDDPDVVNTLFAALREAVQTALQGSPPASLPVLIRAYAKLVIHWAVYSQSHSDPSDASDSESWSTAAAAFEELVDWANSALMTQTENAGSGVETAVEAKDTPEPKRTRSRLGLGREKSGSDQGGRDEALLTVLMLCGDAVALGLLPANGTDDGSLPLRFATTYVRHVYGIVRTFKSRGVSKAAQAADVLEMLKSALSHAAKLAQVWPDTHREEKADLADAIMTVAATGPLNDPPNDMCPTPDGPDAEQPNSPRDKPGTSSVSKRASPVIAFGHRVDSPRSGKKSPERGQNAEASLTQSEDVAGGFADEAAAVLKPWLGQLLVLALHNPGGFGGSAQGTAQSGEAAEQSGTAERTGTTGPRSWFRTLLDGVSASSRADSGAGNSAAEGSDEERLASDQEGLDLPQAEALVGRSTRSVQGTAEDDDLQFPPLLRSILAIASKSSGPAKACLADATAASLLRCMEDGAFDKAKSAAQLLTRIAGTCQRGEQLQSLLSPSTSAGLGKLMDSPPFRLSSEEPTPEAELLKDLKGCLQDLLSGFAARKTLPEANSSHWGTAW